VLRVDRRPFPTVAAHDEALVALWNQTVGRRTRSGISAISRSAPRRGGAALLDGCMAASI